MSTRSGTGALKAHAIGVSQVKFGPGGTFENSLSGEVLRERSIQICFSDPKFRYRPRPNENCLLRIRWASSIPARVMAALAKDLKPPTIAAHRRLIAR